MATKKYLSSLPVGGKVKFGAMYGSPLKWFIAEKNHNGYPANSVTIQTEEHVATIAFDGAEPYAETDDMQWYGRGRYAVSNIDQWLHSQAGKGAWYSARHSVDHSPARGYVDYDHYEGFAGFLNEFDQQEVDMLMPTTRDIPLCSYFGKGHTESVTSSMFLFTDLEYGWATFAKDIIEWHRTASNRTAALSKDAISHAQSLGGRTFTEGDPYPTLTASGYSSDREKVYWITKDGTDRDVKYAYRSAGIRPACNLPSNTLITSEPDEDGYYTVVVNYAPTEPSPIRQEYADDTLEEGYIRAGREITISWARSTDPDGNFDRYELERRYGSGDWTQVYTGTGRTFTETVSYGEASVQYRVRGVDYYDLTSEWVLTDALNIWSNEPPTVAVTTESLGTFQMTGPSVGYTYRDPDAGSLNLKVYLDGVQYRNMTLTAAATDTSGTFTFTADEWLKIQNGNHTVRFLATDSHGETSSASATFTKAVTQIQFRRMAPVAATEAPTEIILRVNGEIPEGATLTVEVCNNAFDASPVWEDMTQEVEDEDIYTFTNTTKTAENWGVDYRITVNRGTATEDIYIESITSNFLAGESSTSRRTGLGVQVATESNDAGGETLIVG